MGAMVATVLFVVLVAFAFYAILLRPVLQQQRRRRLDIANLQIGDEVLTQAGFIARVKDIQVPQDGPTEIILDLGRGVEVQALTSAILQRLRPAPSASAEGRSASGGGSGQAPEPAAEGQGPDVPPPKHGPSRGQGGAQPAQGGPVDE